MTETDAEKVTRLAEQGAERAMEGRGFGFRIRHFGRHADGYMHAQVVPSGGAPVYVHRRFGSWMAPGQLKGRDVLKEVRKEVAIELQREARALEKTERGGRDGEEADTGPDGAAPDAEAGSEPAGGDLRGD